MVYSVRNTFLGFNVHLEFELITSAFISVCGKSTLRCSNRPIISLVCKACKLVVGIIAVEHDVITNSTLYSVICPGALITGGIKLPNGTFISNFSSVVIKVKLCITSSGYVSYLNLITVEGMCVSRESFGIIVIPIGYAGTCSFGMRGACEELVASV